MNKYKKLILNTLIFSMGTFSSKIFSLILLRLCTEYIPTGDYSIATKIRNLINLLEPIVTLSISESVLRFGMDKAIKREKVYTSATVVGLSGIAIGMIILWIISAFTGFKPYLAYMMVFLFTAAFRWIQQQYAKVKNYMKLYAADSVLSSLSLLIFTIIFVAVLKTGIKGYLISIILSDICSILFIMYFADMYKDIKPEYRDIELSKKMIRYSLPLIPTTALWWVVSSSDLFMIPIFESEEINGVYSAAYTIPNFISIISIIFFRAWQMSAIEEYNSEERKHFYTKVFEAYTSVMFVASAGLMIFLEILTHILTSEDYWESFYMAPFLVVAVLMQSFCTFLSSIYNATNNNKRSLSTCTVAAVSNIILNFILISIFGVQGAAFSTMFAYSICFVIRVFDTQRLSGYDVNYNVLIANTVIILFMSLIIILKAPLMYIWLVVAFIVITIINGTLIWDTIKKFIPSKKA